MTWKAISVRPSEKVIRLGEAEAGEELLEEDPDDIRKGGAGAGAARRSNGSMLALSGAEGAYLVGRCRLTLSNPS